MRRVGPPPGRATMTGSRDTTTLAEGDQVHKVSGYKWPGTVVSIFNTLRGETRVVVECTVPEVAGALHIYSPQQIEKDACQTQPPPQGTTPES